LTNIPTANLEKRLGNIREAFRKACTAPGATGSGRPTKAALIAEAAAMRDELKRRGRFANGSQYARAKTIARAAAERLPAVVSPWS
jgi:hypothetical protein